MNYRLLGSLVLLYKDKIIILVGTRCSKRYGLRHWTKEKVVGSLQLTMKTGWARVEPEGGTWEGMWVNTATGLMGERREKDVMRALSPSSSLADDFLWQGASIQTSALYYKVTSMFLRLIELCWWKLQLYMKLILIYLFAGRGLSHIDFLCLLSNKEKVHLFRDIHGLTCLSRRQFHLRFCIL